MRSLKYHRRWCLRQKKPEIGASIAVSGSEMLTLMCAATAMGCSISAEACTRTEAGSGACTGDSGLCCFDTPSSRGAAAAAVHSCDFGTATAAVAKCVPDAAVALCVPDAAPMPAQKFDSGHHWCPGSDAETVITVFWRFCGGPWVKATGSKAKAPASSSSPSSSSPTGIDSSASCRHSLHVLLIRCILYSVICLRCNGVILRTQKVIQGDDNGHVGRPCEVSLAPPCPELFCELRGLCSHSYFGPRTCSRSERPISSK